jgi:Ni/Fe-hydrogenase subunit HybB-like protein
MTAADLRHETPVFGAVRTGDWMAGILGFVMLMGVAAGIARLLIGLQGTTALNDVYPWGIWIGFDFGMIALAGAGFTLAAAVHVLHIERLKPALRPAILAGLCGYTAVLLLLVLDLGRPDRFYHFLLYWNLHSPLFEISWCVLLYSTVLVIEVAPDILARVGRERLAHVIHRFVAPVTIIGVTLSTLHQSTLGTLYLNMPYRLDALWYTPLLPLLFYVSSILAGLAVALVAYRLAVRIQGDTEQRGVLSGLALGIVGVGVLYLVLKLGELVFSGELPLLWQTGSLGWLWGAELSVGVLVPLLLWLVPGWRRRSGVVTAMALLVVASVILNRFDATLFAQTPLQSTGSYTPHMLEWVSTLGILAGAALAWYVIVRFTASRHGDAPIGG